MPAQPPKVTAVTTLFCCYTTFLSKLLSIQLIPQKRRQNLAEVFQSVRKHDKLHFLDNLLLEQTDNMFLMT